MRQHKAFERINDYKLFLMGRRDLFYPQSHGAGHGGVFDIHKFITMDGQNPQDFQFLENTHNWIQYVFPTDGNVTHGDRDRIALSIQDINSMLSKDDQKKTIQTNLKAMLKTVMKFWGLQQKEGEGSLQFELVRSGTPGNLQQAVDRLCSNGYHNFLRISRVLRSLELFELKAEQKAVVEALPLLCEQILAKANDKEQAKAKIQESLHFWLLNIEDDELKASFKLRMQSINLVPAIPVASEVKDGHAPKPSWTRDNAKKMLNQFAKQLDLSLVRASESGGQVQYKFGRVSITAEKNSSQEQAGLQTTADQGLRVKVTASQYKRHSDPKEAYPFSFYAVYSPKTNSLTQVHFPQKFYTFDERDAPAELMADFRCRVKLMVDALLSSHSTSASSATPVELELGNNTITFSDTFIETVKDVVEQNYPGFKLSKVSSKPLPKRVLSKEKKSSSKTKRGLEEMMQQSSPGSERLHGQTSNSLYYGYH